VNSKGACWLGKSIATIAANGNGRWDIAAKTNAAGTLGVDIGAYEFQGGSGDTALSILCPLDPSP